VKISVASNAGAVALVLSLLSGSAWAAPNCARPQDIAALRAAALQQQLMVAALTCGDVDAYNGFVMSHRGELQKSDEALMNFFVRRDAQKGVDDYNAYKTRLANDSSLRRARDPQFCRSANAAFDVAGGRRIPVAELTSMRRSLLDIGYASCMPGASEPMLMADATPYQPARHRALLDSRSSVPVPVLAARPEGLMPPAFPRHDGPSYTDRRFDTAQAGAPPPRDNAGDTRYAEQPQANEPYEENPYDRDAVVRDDNARDDRRTDADLPPRSSTYDRRDDRYDDNADDNSDNSDDYDNGPSENDSSYAYRDAPDAPYAYGPPEAPRMVRGRDGRWYQLMPRGN